MAVAELPAPRCRAKEGAQGSGKQLRYVRTALASVPANRALSCPRAPSDHDRHQALSCPCLVAAGVAAPALPRWQKSLRKLRRDLLGRETGEAGEAGELGGLGGLMFTNSMQVSAYDIARAFFKAVRAVHDPKMLTKLYFYADSESTPESLRRQWFIVQSGKSMLDSESFIVFNAIVLSRKFGQPRKFGKPQTSLVKEAYRMLVALAPKLATQHIGFESQQRVVAANLSYFLNGINVDKTSKVQEPTTYKNAGFDAPAGDVPPEGEALLRLLETDTPLPSLERFVVLKLKPTVENTTVRTSTIHEAYCQWMSDEAARCHIKMPAVVALNKITNDLISMGFAKTFKSGLSVIHNVELIP